MIREYGFEKLFVWHDARNLAKQVHSLTNTLLNEERYRLRSQI